MGEDIWGEPWPWAVSVYKRKFSKRYCSHGYLLPMSKRAAKEHDRRAEKLAAQAKALLDEAKALRKERRAR